MSVLSHISKTTYLPNFDEFPVHVACARGVGAPLTTMKYVCTSGFVDDVTFSHICQAPGTDKANRAYTKIYTRVAASRRSLVSSIAVFCYTGQMDEITK